MTTAPWLALYRDGQPTAIEAEHTNLLDMVADSVRRAPDVPVVRYFDGTLTISELDALADALAAASQDRGFETSSITHLVPPGRTAPVDAASGALSIGVPIASVHARVVDDDGHELPPGEAGELLIRGPQVASGYWGRPDASAASFPDGELHTGDVAFMDAEGWFYLVDRKKDMIIAAGYKVWPREVEDVLYAHPAVREAAVIGVPDEYRGETVHAFVSLQPGAQVTEAELIEHCRQQMAAYKYPRAVFFVDELPKTASGKILRRELRDA